MLGWFAAQRTIRSLKRQLAIVRDDLAYTKQELAKWRGRASGGIRYDDDESTAGYPEEEQE